MEFRLNEYHRNISDEDLLQDVRNVAKKLKKQSITIEEYDKVGAYNHTTLTRRFGSWKDVLSKAGLEVNGHNFHISNQEYIEDLQRVANELGQATVTCGQYDELGKHDHSKLSKRFGGWDKALIIAGLEATGFSRNISDEELFHEIGNMWMRKGSQPTTTDVKKGYSKYSLNTYARRFGGWRNALKEFILYIDSNDLNDDDLFIQQEEKDKDVDMFLAEYNLSQKIHKTPREVNTTLRFKILQRDNFKCCTCGASPAKDPSVELHVDHIIPWVKGGETVLENLQTLCSTCNLGKSDLDM